MTTTPTPDAAPDGQAHDFQDAQPRDAELEQLRGELEQLRAEGLRERADLDNQRKRMARELESARRFANERLLADLLPLFDSMEAGLAAAAESDPLRAGLELTLRQLHRVAASNGLTEV
ncbi:MAG TPA: nucleotide exchange factor GrpE, partial [Luteimonas sp.]|nr:nucleotide exchange factor GrpE [Luteimonas sp.]